MSVPRRRERQDHLRRRLAEQTVRGQVAAACELVQTCGVPMAHVTRHLALAERTVRRWRQQRDSFSVEHRGRPPRCATWEERNAVYRFLKQRGPTTPLAAVRAAFPALRRNDLANILRRFKRVMRRRARRFQSRLEWRRPGAVWAADFKERREPLEGRYGWILSIKDLGSGCQLAWQPLEEATADVVSAIYARLFAEHGPPLVLKSDNGSQFKADLIKDLLDNYRVVPLYSPKRHPQYNGGVERANGQVTGYQESLAEFHARPAGPTRDDAEQARLLANELAHPLGWRGPTACQLWNERAPITPDEHSRFLTTVAQRRAEVREHWNIPRNEELAHYPAAAVDRRAVRDALLAHDLLKIHPRRKRGRHGNSEANQFAQHAAGAGTIESTQQPLPPPTVGGAADLRRRLLSAVRTLFRGGPFLRSKNAR